MPFRFLGDVPLLYTQYRDEAADRPLLADPGGEYDMIPAGGVNLPVPPADGRWGPVTPASGPPPAAAGYRPRS